MIDFFKKPGRWAAVYGALLAAAFTFTLLDAFVIPKAEMPVESTPPAASEPAPGPEAEGASAAESAPAEEPAPKEEPPANRAKSEPEMPAEPVITDTSYTDENISITIETHRVHDTTLYVADIQLADAALLKTAFASNTYGRNIKATTSDMAEEHGAIFAVNGDYYGFRDNGFVLRNGVLYRDTGSGTALVVGAAGDFSFAAETADTAAALADEGAWQAFSFGPVLVEDGEVVVDSGSEVTERSGKSNPRTAIGQAGPLHYMVIVSDGRTKRSAGLSLLELAGEFAARGCTTAYNLDGGGSSTMVFNGRVLNNPTNGRSEKEREISDIVYIGYE